MRPCDKEATIYELLKHSRHIVSPQNRPHWRRRNEKQQDVLEGERWREGERDEAARRRKETPLSPVWRKEEREETAFLQILKHFSQSLECSYYWCQNAFMGHYKPDILSVPSERAIWAWPIYFRFTVQEKVKVHIIWIGMSFNIQYTSQTLLHLCICVSFQAHFGFSMFFGGFFLRCLACHHSQHTVPASRPAEYLISCKIGYQVFSYLLEIWCCTKTHFKPALPGLFIMS